MAQPQDPSQEVKSEPSDAANNPIISDPTNPIQPSEVSSGVRRLHVTNLPFRINESDLSEMFGKYGEIIESEIIYNERGSKGFGFVTMTQGADAMVARKNLNGTVIDGRKIEVNNATPRPKKGPGMSTRGVGFHGNRGMRGGRRGGGRGDGGASYQNQNYYQPQPYTQNQGYGMARNPDPYRSFGQGQAGVTNTQYGGGYGSGNIAYPTNAGGYGASIGYGVDGSNYSQDPTAYTGQGYTNDNYQSQQATKDIHSNSYTQGYRFQPY